MSIELFKGLLGSYVSDARFFALLHLGFIIYIAWLSWRIAGERDHLEGIRPGSKRRSAPPVNSLAYTLRQFQREAEALARVGIIVPLTDFTDRLDGVVDEELGNLRDAVNALLIIGIIGTMFGVYQFAAGATAEYAEAGTTAAPEVINSLAQLLSNSMAAAFPVGVVGLFLTVIGQVVAGRIGGSLQLSLTHATQEVLKARSAALQSPTDQLTLAVAELREVVHPLGDLQSTLGDSLEPVVAEFGRHIEGALSGISAHLGRLDEVGRSIQTAAGGLANGVGELRAQTKDFRRLVREAPKVVDATIELQNRAGAKLDETSKAIESMLSAALEVQAAVDRAAAGLGGVPATLSSIVDGAARDLATRLDPLLSALGVAADRLAAAPDALVERMGPAAEEFAAQAQQTWREASGRVVRDVENEHLQYINAARQSTAEVEDSMTRAARGLTELATTWRDQVVPALERTVDEALVSKYPEALGKVEEAGRALTEAAGPVREGTAAVGALTEQLRVLRVALASPEAISGSGGPDPVLRALDDVLRELKAVRARIDKAPSPIRRGPPFPTTR